MLILVTVLIGLIHANVGADCSKTSLTCGTGECCGLASKDPNYTTATNNAKNGVVRTVCNIATDTTWIEDITKANADYYTDISITTGKAAYIYSCKADSAKYLHIGTLATTFILVLLN